MVAEVKYICKDAVWALIFVAAFMVGRHFLYENVNLYSIPIFFSSIVFLVILFLMLYGLTYKGSTLLQTFIRFLRILLLLCMFSIFFSLLIGIVSQFASYFNNYVGFLGSLPVFVLAIYILARLYTPLTTYSERINRGCLSKKDRIALSMYCIFSILTICIFYTSYFV
jgi:hypothetical protein